MKLETLPIPFVGLITSIFFAFGLSLLNFPGALGVSLVLFLYFLFPKHRNLFLCLGLLCNLFFWEQFNVFGRVDFFEIHREEHPDLGLPLRVLGAAIGLLVFLVLLFMFRRIRLLKKYPIWSLFGLLFAAAVFLNVQRSNPWVLYAMVPLAILCRYFWFLGYAVQASVIDWRRDFPTLLPFWSKIEMPIPSGIDRMRKASERFRNSPLSIQAWNGIRLLFWALALSLLRDVSNKVFFNWSGVIFPTLPLPSLNLPILDEVKFTKELFDGISYWELWGTLLARAFDFILKTAILGLMMVAVARAFGFYVYRVTYKPYLAKNLFDFMQRINYYYMRILSDLFFYKIYYRIPRAFGKAPRLFLTVFLSVVFGGVIFHFLQDIYLFRQVAMTEIFRMSGSHAVYNVIMGVTIGMAAIRERNRRILSLEETRGAFGFSQFVNLVGIFVLYSLTLAFAAGWKQNEIADYLHLFRAIFLLPGN